MSDQDTNDPGGFHLFNASDIPDETAAGAIAWAVRKVAPEILYTTGFFLGAPKPGESFRGLAYVERRNRHVPQGLDWRIDLYISPDPACYPVSSGETFREVLQGASLDEATLYANEIAVRSGRPVQIVQVGGEYAVQRVRGYGGKTSPINIFTHWTECIVHVAAHEAQHIRQAMTTRKFSEVECERVAHQTLRWFRMEFGIPEPPADTVTVDPAHMAREAA